MSQQVGQTELKAKTQQLLDGPLKHIRAAAIAAALLPLASVAATPASAQGTFCPSGGTLCGLVWDDANKNGIQDAGESGITSATVYLYDSQKNLVGTAYTGSDGVYSFFVPDGTYTVAVLTGDVLQGMKPSPSNVGSDDTSDSDGTSNGAGFSVATVTLTNGNNTDTDFGYVTAAAPNPGTGTPGYWKNHPEAWPVDASGAPVTIMIGGVPYSKTAALAGLAKITKDKTTTMFSSLLSAKLNVLIGNDDSCLSGAYGAIAQADAWMAIHPLNSNVLASSDAWKIGEPFHQTLDAYNNGLLCAPHRQ